ncbi:MAG: TlpA family protein disulfide reductase [Candidatus Omnitrophica bacterium]|nr:TlpA family protein disulfide reductase [Candidatus Omnitrophota bacterium]
MRNILITAIFLLSSFCGSLSQALAEKGMLANDFVLEDMSGEKVRLSDYRGKEEVILLFWAYRCHFCRNDLKALGSKAEELKKYNNIELLSINVEDSKKVIERFFARYNINLKTLIDRNGDVAYDYGIIGIPAYIWIDKEGRIKYEGHSLPKITINKPIGE